MVEVRAALFEELDFVGGYADIRELYQLEMSDYQRKHTIHLSQHPFVCTPCHFHVWGSVREAIGNNCVVSNGHRQISNTYRHQGSI